MVRLNARVNDWNSRVDGDELVEDERSRQRLRVGEVVIDLPHRERVADVDGSVPTSSGGRPMIRAFSGVMLLSAGVSWMVRSTAPKKNVRFGTIGPPSEPPNSLPVEIGLRQAALFFERRLGVQILVPEVAVAGSR